MKKILLITALLVGTVSQAQSLTAIYSEYIQPTASAEELREGFNKVEALCAVTPEEKCNKAKASALYLLCDDYYEAAYQVCQVDKELAQPILNKAKALYKQANSYMLIDDFTEEQKNILLNSKHLFESNPLLKTL